jgi:hypothetical protein
MRHGLRTLLIVLVLAYLTLIAMYLVEEARFNAAERERIRQTQNQDSPIGITQSETTQR